MQKFSFFPHISLQSIFTTFRHPPFKAVLSASFFLRRVYYLTFSLLKLTTSARIRYAVLIPLFGCFIFARSSPDITPKGIDNNLNEDFGTEVITASLYGTVSAFTHTALATVSTDYAGNAEIKLADSMVSAVNQLVEDSGVCPGTEALKERTLPPGLKKRNPPIRTAPLAPEDCTTRCVNAMIDQMRVGGRFDGLIALVRTSAVINRGLDGALLGSWRASTFVPKTLLV